MTTPFATVRDLLRYAVTRFSKAKLAFGHGSDNAYDEAAYLRSLRTLDLPLDTLESVPRRAAAARRNRGRARGDRTARDRPRAGRVPHA